jgi:hypothetical protein
MFRFNDGSVLKHCKASAICLIEIWKGNRLRDDNHISRINNSLDTVTSLDKQPYTVAIINVDGQERKFVIDGQHRIAVLKRYFEALDVPDFDVLVIEVPFQDESEIIQYFKILNQTKSIQWKEDPIMVANTFVSLLCKEFNKDPKKPLIKPGKTNKPYLSSDRVREALIQRHVVDWKTTPQEFVLRCREINDSNLEDLDISVNTNKRAKELKFVLGIMDFNWM